MRIPDLYNTTGAIRTAIFFAGILPPRLGRRISRLLADIQSSRRNSPNVKAVLTNQRVVCGGQCSQPELERRMHEVFRTSGRCLFDFYHALSKPDRHSIKVSFSPEFQALMQRQLAGLGQFLVLPHISAFDLVGMEAVRAGMQMQVLTYARPPATYRLENRIRRYVGMQATPISGESMRKALERLRNGGTVLTGVDRPPQGQVLPAADQPSFFGLPANLHTGYLRLVQRAQVPLAVVAAQSGPPGEYRVWASELIDPPSQAERSILDKAEEILERIAQVIRSAPEQWLMYYPVWPQEMR